MASSSRQNRGHLALKSSALAPTAMSYMGQDLILNHMKSHYRRISSAKASIDTSAPKSMKKHIRVRDQKKREGMKSQSEGPVTPGRRARSASLENLSGYSPSPSPISRPPSSRQHQRSNSANMGSPYRPQSAGGVIPRNSTPTPLSRVLQRTEEADNLERTIHNPHLKMTEASRTPNSNFSPRLLPGPLVSHTRWKRVQQRESPGYRTPTDSRTGDRRAVKARMQEGQRDSREQETKNRDHNNYRTENFNINLNDDSYYYDEGELNSYRSMQSGRVSTRLNSSRSSARAVTPLQKRLREEKEIETKLWEEEQLYMQFISDVTSDILARGIFTNRVLNKVFESHIDKRRDELDETRMRAMISQLRVDLGAESHESAAE